MLCQRCRGLLVRETFSDLREEAASLYPATRCINCGYVEDAVVRLNRLRSHMEKRSAPRGLDRRGILSITIRSENCGAF